MDESDLHEIDTYPEKPSIEESGNSLNKSVWSAVLFIVAFYFFFDQDIVYILLLVLVLFIHEMGHFLAMKMFNYKDVKMFFVPLLGALVTGEKSTISQRQRAIVILAGPIPGIIIGVLLYTLQPAEDSYLTTAANIFIFLNIFNLLPIYPLDGGNLLRTLFFSKKETLQTIFTVLSILGLIAIALYLESYVFLVIPAFMALGLFQQSNLKKVRKLLDAEGFDINKSYEELSNKEFWQIRDHLIQQMPGYQELSPGDYSPSKFDKSIVKQIKSFTISSPIQDLSGLAKIFILAIWLVFFIGPFIAIAFIS